MSTTLHYTSTGVHGSAYTMFHDDTTLFLTWPSLHGQHIRWAAFSWALGLHTSVEVSPGIPWAGGRGVHRRTASM